MAHDGVGVLGGTWITQEVVNLVRLGTNYTPFETTRTDPFSC